MRKLFAKYLLSRKSLRVSFGMLIIAMKILRHFRGYAWIGKRSQMLVSSAEIDLQVCTSGQAAVRSKPSLMHIIPLARR
jgi:hypothetical protein